MSWQIGKNKYPQMAMVWEIEDKGTWASVKLGTSRKDKRSGEYVNSNWSYVRFVANAYPSILKVKAKTRIVIESGQISQEPYVKDGEKLWPKNPNIVVFAWSYPDDAPKNDDMEDVVDNSDEEDLPF